MIKTKSLRTPIDRKGDGLRILVARFRGHRVKKTQYDVWMPSLGPSEELLKTFRAGEWKWAEFSRRYRQQIFSETETDRANATVKNHGQKFTLRLLRELGARQHVTLLCHCAENEPHCHRHLLARLISAA